MDLSSLLATNCDDVIVYWTILVLFVGGVNRSMNEAIILCEGKY